MTEDYCKLASGIIFSTIWRADNETRILWITMLALKNRDHQVKASIPGLAAVANIPLEACRASLLKLMSPDIDSGSKEHGGRRIQEIDGGWFVLNGEKYRNYMTRAERNEYQAKLMAERRAKGKMLAPVSTELALLGQAEAEADPNANKKEGVSPTLDEVKTRASMTAMVESDAVAFWNHFESVGWIDKNGHSITRWQSKMDNWKVTTAANNHKNPSTRAPTAYELKTVIEAKQAIATDLKHRYSSEAAMGTTWDDPLSKKEYSTIMAEIRTLRTKLASMA